MKDKKIIIEEIARMRSMMGLNEGFVPRLLLESVTPQRLKQLMLDFVGAADNSSRRSIINNLSTDEKQIFNDFLSNSSSARSNFGNARNIDEFLDISKGVELMKLARQIAARSDDFVKSVGKNINFAASIDNLSRIQSELNSLKPSIANLADDIDPNSDYGKLMQSITNKEYGEVDIDVFNDFSNFLMDLKTKTNDPNVQQYLDGVYDDMTNIVDDIEEVMTAKDLNTQTYNMNIMGDNGEYFDSSGNYVDAQGNLINANPFSTNQFADDFADDLEALRLGDDVVDIETQTTQLSSRLKTAIINSDQFKEAVDKLPGNIKPNDLADQIVSTISERLKKEINLISDKAWDQLGPADKIQYVDLGLAALKKAKPTQYEKLKKSIDEFLAKNPKALSKKKLFRIWWQGALLMAGYQIYDVINTTQTQGGDAGDMTNRIADAVLQTVIWPVSVATLGRTSIEKDYVNTKQAFYQFAIDNNFATIQNYKEKVSSDEKGNFYVKKIVGPPGNQKEEFVPYEYDLMLGTFVEKSSSSSSSSSTPTGGGSIVNLDDINKLVKSNADFKNVTIESFTFVNKTGDVETYSLKAKNGTSGTLTYDIKTKAVTIS